MSTVRTTFDEQLTELQRDVVRMGSFVIRMLDLAMSALTQRNVRLADEVIRMDDLADEMDLNIETSGMHLLALQQPMSRDLRTIASALRIISDLERIGDYAADIAQAVRHLTDEAYLGAVEDITRMSRRAGSMVRGAVQAFVDHDTGRAEHICQQDDAVDELYNQVFDDLVQAIEEAPRYARQGGHLLLIARRLERVADHATNIAERVYYMETGRLEQLAKTYRAGGNP